MSNSITTSALNTTTTAIQFTLTDVGSDWTQTNVTHVIDHKGTQRIRTDRDPDVQPEEDEGEGRLRDG